MHNSFRSVPSITWKYVLNKVFDPEEKLTKEYGLTSTVSTPFSVLLGNG